MRVRAVVAAALLAGVVAVFAPLREHEFVDYDDPVYLAMVAPGLSRDGLASALEDVSFANWIPVTTFSLLVSRELHDDRAPGFLIGNLALHAATTVLLFLVLSGATGASWPSAFVAAVFGWHPLHVESVAWMSQRKDVLSGFFSVLALGLHARALRRPSSGRRAATLVAVLLALLSKPTAVSLPFLLVLFEWWPLRRLACSPRTGLPTPRSVAASLLAKWPMLLLSAAICAVTYRAQEATGNVAAANALPFAVRAANAVDSLRAYLFDAVWPQGLAAFYPHPTAIESPAATLATALVLAGWTALALALARRQPALAMGWLWFLGALVPMLGLVQVGLQARADRYTYLPLCGLAIGVAFPLAALAAPHAAARRALAAVALAALIAFGVVARAQVHTWRDSLALYTRATEVAPSAFASLGLGRALRRAGRGDEAVAWLGEAARLRPLDAMPRLELAEYYAARGQLDVALAHQREAVRLAPDDARYALRLAQLLLQAGRPAQAQPLLIRAGSLLEHGGGAPAALRSQYERLAARAKELGYDPSEARAAPEASAQDE